MLNPRQMFLLNQMENKSHLDIREASQIYGVTERTIRYDLEKIEKYLNRSGELSRHVIIKHGSIALQETQNENATPVEKQDIFAVQQEFLSPSERFLRLAFDLCSASGWQTIDDLCKKYTISRSTLNRDLGKVRSYLSTLGMSLESIGGKGIRITADEESIRSSLTQIVRDYYELSNNKMFTFPELYSDWFIEEDFQKVIHIVTECEIVFAYHLDDVTYEALVLHILLSLKRAEHSVTAEYSEPLSSYCASTDSENTDVIAHMAAYIVSEIEQEFLVSLPKEEFEYIKVHLLVKKNQNTNDEQSGQDPDIELVTFMFAELLEDEFSLPFSQDAKFIKMFAMHIEQAKYRLQHGLSLSNPLRKELDEEFPRFRSFVAAEVEEGLLKTYVRNSRDEISYLVVHIAASYTRLQQLDYSEPKVLLICSTGQGTAELLRAELRRHFNFKQLTCTSRHQFISQSHEMMDGIDIIISCVDLPSDYTYIKVSPLLRPQDIRAIRSKISQVGTAQHVNNAQSITHIEELAEDDFRRQVVELVLHSHVNSSENELIADLRKLIDETESRKKRGYMLSELLGVKHIQLDRHCKDWKEAIALAGEPLIDTHCITSDYVDACVESVSNNGPYVVITRGVALPHAFSSEGVIKTAMSFVRLSDPVNFGSPENDPVKYLFMLATEGSEYHIKALSCLARLLATSEFKELMAQAGSAEEFQLYIQNHEC